MQKITKKNSIYLSGGGDESQSFTLDEYFFNKLPNDGHFLYMPLALRGSDLYLTAGLWLVKVLELHGRSDLTFEIADDLLRYQNEDIGKFKAIYIGGGNTWNLIRELKDSYFDDKLSKYLELGGIIYGGSAGAIILGKRIDTHDDENKISYTDTSGLNFLNHFSVACHYREEQSNRFKEWSEHNNSSIICLQEETGLIIENDSAFCLGTKPCTIFHSDGSRLEIKPEEFYKL